MKNIFKLWYLPLPLVYLIITFFLLRLGAPKFIAYLTFLIGAEFIIITLFVQFVKPNFKGWITQSPINFFFYSLIAILPIILFWDFFYLYDIETSSFKNLDNILVEAHGLLFDILVFGILFYIYDKLRSQRDRTERLLEELEDYRGWYDNEAAFRVKGIYTRLKQLNHDLIDLDNLHIGKLDKTVILAYLDSKYKKVGSLEGASLANSKFDELEFSRVNLSEANLRNACFSNSRAINSNFTNAYLTNFEAHALRCMGSIFENALLKNSTFNDCQLDSAIFKNAYLDNASFKGCSLYSTDFTGCSLIGASFILCLFSRQLKLDQAKVDSLDWVEINFGSELSKEYVVGTKKHIDPETLKEYFVIEPYVTETFFLKA